MVGAGASPIKMLNLVANVSLGKTGFGIKGF